MNELTYLQTQAKRRLALRKDPRFKRALETFQVHGLLLSTDQLVKTHQATRASFEDIYFAAELEPRFFEVLPALAFRKPSALLDPWKIPNELKMILREIRIGNARSYFHGFKPEEYMFWVNWLKRKNSRDRTFRKNFRFASQDLARIRFLQKKLKLRSESELIRKAIESLEISINSGLTILD